MKSIDELRHKRNLAILLDRLKGLTLEVIADKHGVTREGARKAINATFDRLVTSDEKLSELRQLRTKSFEKLNQAIEQLRNQFNGCSLAANKRTSRVTRSALGAGKGSNAL